MEESLYYNALAIATHGSYKALKSLRSCFPSWKEAFDDLYKNGLSPPDPKSEAQNLKRQNIRLILSEDPDFPPLLREISDPPFGIYVRGVLPRESRAIAIVGTRKATHEGKRTAKHFAHALAAAGFAIVSGLALGIDAAAHDGTLEVGGLAIAVLANGLDTIYPHTNERLALKILAAGGCIISEYPPGEEARKHRFLERNRIVSGLANGTLVVEAPLKSGSVATARFAFEQNRDVFVIPGGIAHPNFQGSHKLIRQGAELVTKPEDILEVYGITKKDISTASEKNVEPHEKLILKALREVSSATTVDKLIDMTKLEPQILNQHITFLLLKGIIKETEGGYTI